MQGIGVSLNLSLAQNHFFNDPADAAGRQPGSRITDRGDHDIKHDPAEQPAPWGIANGASR